MKLSKAEDVKVKMLTGWQYTPPKEDESAVLTEYVTFSDGSVLNLKTMTVYD